MITSQKTQTYNFSDDVNNLLCQIDVELSKMAGAKLTAYRFGGTCKIDADKFFILNTYRKILQDKANNSCCLVGYSVDTIISYIKQYISAGKIVNTKN